MRLWIPFPLMKRGEGQRGRQKETERQKKKAARRKKEKRKEKRDRRKKEREKERVNEYSFGSAVKVLCRLQDPMRVGAGPSWEPERVAPKPTSRREITWCPQTHSGLLCRVERVWGLTSPFFCPQTLELLCQILQTDSLSAIQFWLLYAPPQGEDT